MWRTLVSPVLHKQVGILRTSSGSCTSRFCFISTTGNGNESSSKETPVCKTLINRNLSSSISKANRAIIGLFGKPPDSGDKLSRIEPISLIHLLIKHVKDTHISEGSHQNDLTICVPRNDSDGKQSGFAFRNICLGIEKWCYGVVVVSGLISWHRFLLNDEAHNGKNDVFYHIYQDSLGTYPVHILPVNGPAMPIDPVDAAFASFENVVTECTAVTQNALGIKFSTLNLHEKAVSYFKSASSKGNVAAHFNLGLCYEQGIGTTKDISKAVKSYRFAATQGHLEASYNIGALYLEGKHFSGKNNEGLELIEEAATKGLVKAQRFLGLYYADKMNEHYDMKRSVKWLHSAAEQNDLTAQYHLGICHERGFGVARNMSQAKTWYGQAAENGHSGAQYNYAVFHEHGLGGLSVDKHEALRWYKMASDNDNMNAKHNLECLQKELHGSQRIEGKPSLLPRFVSDFWKSKEPISSTAGIIPRCSSSPGRLYTKSELDVNHDSPHHTQHRTFEDKKCIGVI